jgi:haloacetate dehalogenase
MLTARIKKAFVNGIDLAYFDAGEGTPIVMVHGWPQHSFCWRKFAALLIPHYRVIALDLRGCGDSETVPGGFDKKTLAADISALVHHLGLEHVVIAGMIGEGP